MVRESEPQGKPTKRWVKEDGESQSRSVIERIGVELADQTTSDITPRESAPTSIGSCRTRELAQPVKERKQMTTDSSCTVGAVSHELSAWHAIDWQAAEENVRRLQARIVKATQLQTLCCCVSQEALARLEPDARKPACPVLRGGSGGNAAPLPD